jgi:hypothetical protein
MSQIQSQKTSMRYYKLLMPINMAVSLDNKLGLVTLVALP